MPRMLRIVAAMLVIALVGAACTDGEEPPIERATSETPERSETPGAGDMSADDLVRGAWTGPGGSAISTEVVNVIRGPEHCDWESSVWLHLGWPPGTEADDASQIRQYIRDPENVLDFADGLDSNAELPDGALATEFKLEGVELWLGVDGGDEAVYLVFPDHVERWPRSREIIACF